MRKLATFLFLFMFLILLHFLHQINLCGKVVGVAIEPYACCMRTKRAALEFAILLKQIVAHENGMLIVLECGAVSAYKIATQHYLVEKVPLAIVEQGALSDLVKCVVPRVVHILGTLHILNLALATKL